MLQAEAEPWSPLAAMIDPETGRRGQLGNEITPVCQSGFQAGCGRLHPAL